MFCFALVAVLRLRTPRTRPPPLPRTGPIFVVAQKTELKLLNRFRWQNKKTELKLLNRFRGQNKKTELKMLNRFWGQNSPRLYQKSLPNVAPNFVLAPTSSEKASVPLPQDISSLLPPPRRDISSFDDPDGDAHSEGSCDIPYLQHFHHFEQPPQLNLVCDQSATGYASASARVMVARDVQSPSVAVDAPAVSGA